MNSLGIQLRILWEFFGHPMGIMWEFFGNNEGMLVLTVFY